MNMGVECVDVDVIVVVNVTLSAVAVVKATRRSVLISRQSTASKPAYDTYRVGTGLLSRLSFLFFSFFFSLWNLHCRVKYF